MRIVRQRERLAQRGQDDDDDDEEEEEEEVIEVRRPAQPRLSASNLGQLIQASTGRVLETVKDDEEDEEEEEEEEVVVAESRHKPRRSSFGSGSRSSFSSTGRVEDRESTVDAGVDGERFMTTLFESTLNCVGGGAVLVVPTHMIAMTPVPPQHDVTGHAAVSLTNVLGQPHSALLHDLHDRRVVGTLPGAVGTLSYDHLTVNGGGGVEQWEDPQLKIPAYLSLRPSAVDSAIDTTTVFVQEVVVREARRHVVPTGDSDPLILKLALYLLMWTMRRQRESSIPLTNAECLAKTLAQRRTLPAEVDRHANAGGYGADMRSGAAFAAVDDVKSAALTMVREMQHTFRGLVTDLRRLFPDPKRTVTVQDILGMAVETANAKVDISALAGMEHTLRQLAMYMFATRLAKPTRAYECAFGAVAIRVDGSWVSTSHDLTGTSIRFTDGGNLLTMSLGEMYERCAVETNSAISTAVWRWMDERVLDIAAYMALFKLTFNGLNGPANALGGVLLHPPDATPLSSFLPTSPWFGGVGLGQTAPISGTPTALLQIDLAMRAVLRPATSVRPTEGGAGRARPRPRPQPQLQSLLCATPGDGSHCADLVDATFDVCIDGRLALRHIAPGRGMLRTTMHNIAETMRNMVEAKSADV